MVAPVLARAIDVTLVRIRPFHTAAILRRPVDLVDRDDLGYTRTHLAYSRRGVPKSRLVPPTVVGPVLARAIDATLVRIRPVHTIAILRRPVDLVDRDDLGTTRVHLVPSSRGIPKSKLAAPTVVGPVLARSPQITLVRIKPARTIARLAPPTIVFSATPSDAVSDITLTYSVRGRPRSFLLPPTVIAPVLARRIAVELVRIKPAATRYVLRPPVVVYLAVEIYGPELTLAPSRRGTPKSELRPPVPAETFPPVSEEVAVQLALAARQHRKTISRLEPPVVVFTAVELSGPETSLAYSLRGAPKSILSPPVPPETFPPVSEEIAVQLAVAGMRRRDPIYRLAPPTVVYLAVELSGPETSLAYQSRRPGRSFLRPMGSPAVVYRAILTHLTYSSRGEPKSFLREPSKFAPQPAPVYPTNITLAYSLRGIPKSKLRSPTVVTAANPSPKR